MLCKIGETAEQTVVQRLQKERMIGEIATDGTYPLIGRKSLFDKMNSELTGEIYREYGVINQFFTRVNETVHFNRLTGMLIDSLNTNKPDVPFPGVILVKPLPSYAEPKLTFSPRTKVVENSSLEDEVVNYTDLSIEFDDGASAQLSIYENHASISGINAFEKAKGTMLYERVLAEILNQGKATVVVGNQSKASRIKLAKLVESGVLLSPRNYKGVSTEEYATTFDIDQHRLYETLAGLDIYTPNQEVTHTAIPLEVANKSEAISSPGLPDLQIPEGFKTNC